MEGTQVQPEQDKAKKFYEEYTKLCEKHGYRIVVNPAWIARDDGSWSLVLQTSVGKIPKLQTQPVDN